MKLISREKSNFRQSDAQKFTLKLSKTTQRNGILRLLTICYLARKYFIDTIHIFLGKWNHYEKIFIKNTDKCYIMKLNHHNVQIFLFLVSAPAVRC